MEMTKKISLETLRSVLGRSILHYSCKVFSSTVLSHGFLFKNLT